MKNKSIRFWIILDAVLVILIIVLVSLLMKKNADEVSAEGDNKLSPTVATGGVPDGNSGNTQPPTPTEILPTPTTSVIGWNEREGGKRQYIDADHNLLMSTHQKIDGVTYFFDEAGYVRTGWYTDASGTYFFAEDSGAMVVGEVDIDGEAQIFDENGRWLGKASEIKLTPTPTSVPSSAPVSSQTPDIDVSAYAEYSAKAEGWWFERKTDHSASGAYGFDTKYKFTDNDTFFINPDVTAEDKVIYLTFDCGYENGYTASILDTMKKHNATGTFFVTKSYIRDATDLVLRMKEEGHLVGNHTVTHPNLANCSTEKVVEELTQCSDYMKEKTGYSMDAFLRPPEGAYSEKTLQIAQDLGYKTILWSMAYLDWDVTKQPGKEYVINHFEKYHHNGAIPLIHVVSESNMQALDEVLTMLENEGYRFGSLTELQ